MAKACSHTPGPLPRLLHSGKISPSLFNGVLQLALDIAWGMQHIHQRGIIHGDLNPRNVLIKIQPDAAPLGCVAKVADFGLALRLPASAPSVQGIRHGTVSGRVLSS